MGSRFVWDADSAQFAERTSRLSPRRRITPRAGTAFSGALAFSAAAAVLTNVALTEPAAAQTWNAGNQATAGALLTFFAGTTVVNDNLDDKINAGEGEFSNVTRSYAGKGVVRYAW